MEKEIYKMQNMLAGKKYSSLSIQTEIKGQDIQSLNEQLNDLHCELKRVENENQQLIKCREEYEDEINNITLEKEHINNEYHRLLNTFDSNNKKNIKSTTSLAYSIDDE